MTGLEYGGRNIALGNEILRTVVGSGVHGIAIEGTDDHDEMGIYIEPAEYLTGLVSWVYPGRVPDDEHRCRRIHDGQRCVKGFEHMSPHDYDEPGAGRPGIGDGIGQGMPHYVSRTHPEGARSGPGDVDLVAYSLRKYLRLAIKGNPTALLPLFAPRTHVIHTSPLGDELRAMRDKFLSRQAADRFISYMHEQHRRMLGHGRQSAVPNRPELVERYGYDVKYAAHALRLAYEGHELITTGNLTLPMPTLVRSRVLAVKRGERTRDDVSKEIVDIGIDCTTALRAEKTPLPPEPDLPAISAWSQQAHLIHWQSAADASERRPWPGYCQACGAPLTPPNSTSCRSCGRSDADE